MTRNALHGVEACVFDAYGTLFDVHSAVGRHAAALGDTASALSALWRQKQLEYSWLRALMGAYVDFWQVTADALDTALARYGIDDPGLRRQLLDAYLELDAYPEVAHALTALQTAGHRLAILSNGAPTMLEAAVRNAALAERFAAVLSVDRLATYKPRPEVYALASETLGVSPPAVCFVSSNAWDVHGAAHCGFRAVWINRFDQAAERLPAGPVATIRTLDELAGLLA